MPPRTPVTSAACWREEGVLIEDFGKKQAMSYRAQKRIRGLSARLRRHILIARPPLSPSPTDQEESTQACFEHSECHTGAETASQAQRGRGRHNAVKAAPPLMSPPSARRKCRRAKAASRVKSEPGSAMSERAISARQIFSAPGCARYIATPRAQTGQSPSEFGTGFWDGRECILR